ncbi:MAG: hypothetical protein GY765_40805 [bacterium]|nr:hypothetical protein [bacterium]
MKSKFNFVGRDDEFEDYEEYDPDIEDEEELCEHDSDHFESENFDDDEVFVEDVEEVHDAHGDARRDIWSNIEWDKD